MAKRKRRRPFESNEPIADKPEKLIDTTSGIFGLMRDYGVRETVESIVIAVVLALMFRSYEAEAFIIPTGSMAPTLQGQHMDVVCDECGHQYRAGASRSSPTTPKQFRAEVAKTNCPICRYSMPMQKQNNADHVTNNGDRILVNKFVYDFQSPERFDVIVFKNPNNGKQNYIKRLVGLPGDNLLIENGDIFNFVEQEDGTFVKTIVRKPADKIDVMLQLVDDTNFISPTLKSAGWPSRWNQWSSPNTNWKNQETDGHPYFTIDGSNTDLKWLRYRHLAPRSLHDEFVANTNGRPAEWDSLEKNELPLRIKNRKGEIATGALIRDHYEYNDQIYQQRNNSPLAARAQASPGFHWVGDLAGEFDIVVESESGSVAFDLVEGGVHFTCTIDIASGQATLKINDSDNNISFNSDNRSAPTATTKIKGKGKHKVLLANVDDKIFLFVDKKHVDFGDASSYSKTNDVRPIPKYSANDPGDAEPIGIAAAQAKVRVNRLKVFRDIYYIAPTNIDREGNVNIRSETGLAEGSLVRVYEEPRAWQSPNGRKIFARPRTKVGLLSGKDWMFQLEDGHYFPMGDNSPASQDARIWDGPKFVDEDMLIGRAMFVYWPHSLNKPIPYFPNFKRMGFIR